MLLSYSTGPYGDYNLANKVSTTGDATISGNLNVDGRILIDGSHLNVQPKSSTSSETLVFDQSFSSEFGSDSHGINVYGRPGGNSHLEFYNDKSGSVCNVLIYGNLDVGGDTSISGQLNVQSNNSFETKAVLEHTGGTYCSLYWKGSGVQGQIYVGGSVMEVRTNSNHLMRFKTGGSAQPTTMTTDINRNKTVHRTFCNNSDDRIKENEKLITCL